MLLVLSALPMQTAAHTWYGSRGNERNNSYELGHRGSATPEYPPNNVINWVRVYKNPLRVPAADLTPAGVVAYGFRIPSTGNSSVPVYDFSMEDATPSALRFGYLKPSYYNMPNQEFHWVQFDADGNLFEDPAKPGESGLVTATDNTAVKVGDIVAIAINIRSWRRQMSPDVAIGPIEFKPYVDEFGKSVARNERKWRLNANMPMWSGSPVSGGYGIGNPIEGRNHTFVYQFKVEPAHLILNDGGTWLKQDWETPADIRDVTRGSSSRPDDEDFRSGNRLAQWTAFDWLWESDDKYALPPKSAVKVFNTVRADARQMQDWGVTDLSLGWAYLEFLSDVVSWRQGLNDVHHYRILKRGEASHRHVPLYDPALPGKEAIFYPKIERPGSRATTTLSNVPEGTQTGAFTVALRFADGSIFEGHDLSEDDIADFKEALEKALEDSDWTVEALAVEEEKRPRIASSGVDGETNPSASTEYQLTLSPSLGVKGAFPLQIPENVVMDAGKNGNLASESVTVSVDTELRVAAGKAVEIAAPAAGAYLADDVIEVLVPFAQDGLTYEGEAPPYLTIYLGEAARHATWQQGEESAGSTLVPFKYVIDRADPIAESVRVGDEGLSIPTGTTLMNGAGLSRVGSDPMPMGSGKAPESSPPKPLAERLQILTSAGAPLPAAQTEKSVTVLPTPPVYLPPDDSAPKAGMSSIPRSPIVFNELGNGSGDTNDWLELRNVTGDVVSLKDWELSVVQDGKKEDTSLIVFPDVSVPANGLLLLTNQPSDKTPLAGGDDIAASDEKKKGLSHLTLVQSGLSLPDDGKFLLILRNAKEKRGLNEAFVDVAGGGGSGTDAFVREQEGDYDTYVWPLQVLEAPGSATEDALSSGKVWLRAKADIVGYHRDAWAEAAFTGVGYDRKVSKSAETAGTPGYPNGAVKTEPATPRGAITISEVMLDSAGGTLPQWVELYNASKTDALNLNRWELEIQNVDSEDLVGRPIVRLTLQEKVIQPNQTLLIVTGNARASSADVFPEDRVYNLLELHDKNLRIKKPSDTFLSAKGFYLRLTDRNEHLVDEVGNTDGNRRTDDTPAWALPMPLSEVEGMRSSLVRRYDKGVARDGKEKSSWALAANFAKFKVSELHYGHADDIGTPGYRQGGALPVELSSFTVTRLESGSVIVTWTTESEVDNAGFNLRRSLTRDGGYTLLNPALIAGAGTTGERQTYTFIDTSAKLGVEHYYQIEEVSFGGKAETLVTRRLRGPVSPAHRALKTLGEVKQAK